MNNINLLKNMPKSYWISSTEDTNYPSLNDDVSVDIAIVGGGMVGILTAYELEKQGFNIAIIEAEKIVQSTTAHTTAKLTSQHNLIYDKLVNQMGRELAQQYARANESAIHQIKKIADENNINCDYESQFAYIYTQEDKYKEDIVKEVEAARLLGIDAELISDIPFPIDIKTGMVFRNQAQFHPRKFLLKLAEILNDRGVSIYEKTRAIELNSENDKYIINTDVGKKVTAEKVIIATHYPFFNKKSMYYARLYVERSYILGIKAKEKYPGGMYINAEEPPRSLRYHPTDDGELILVVGENHKTGQGENTNEHYEALLNFAKDIFTIKDIPFRWSTQDCFTLDGIPYVGQYASDTPNLYVATGFAKWGMTNSVASSIILRDLVFKGESPWADVYNPSRKTIVASTKNFVVQNANVASQLIEGKLSNTDNDVELKPGDAVIVEVDGDKVGCFRDDEGKLHLVNTTCTHMGCELKWNSAERSWDCPCHGSRFTYEGKVLHGPAVKPLNFDRDVNTIEKVIKEDY
ncbi:MAG: FAD-dependent oxidoreductase [Tissierellaceae bacterium]|nr:FAD-dependent oxidoreductase [Tissierellaceae bacterium]